MLAPASDDGRTVGPSDRPRRWLLWLSLAIAAWMVIVVAAVLLTADGQDGDAETADSTTLTSPASTTPVPTSVSTTAPATTPTTSSSSTASTATTTTASSTSAPPEVAETTTTPSTSAAPSVAAVSQDEAQSFFQTYYDEVNAGEYTSSWARLTPEFQNGMARSFDYYVDFWDENDVEVRGVQLVSSNTIEARVHVDLRWNGRGRAITDEFLLRRSETGELLIASETTVDR